MKTIILTHVLFFLHLTNISAQWEIIHDGTRLGWLNTIDFVNEDIGWIGGDNGTLLKTTDGGENWNSVPVNESWQIYHIDFITESTGWAIGRSGTHPNYTYPIWKSSDSGQTWLQQYSSTTFGFSSLYAIDENNVYAAGRNKIYKSTNGGTNWLNVSPNLPDREYFSVWFQNSQTGVVVGNYNDGTTKKGIILKTTNGGTNWTETIVSEFNSIYDLQFLDSSYGYFRAHKDTAHLICKTVDMFTSWNVIAQVISPSIWKNPIPSYQLIDYNLAYAIVSDTSYYTYNILETTDEGSSWQNIQTIKYVNINKIYINKQNFGFLLGYFPSGDASPIIISRIHMQEWILQKFSYPLSDVCALDKDKGIYLGSFYVGLHLYEGVIFSSNNGGITTNIRFSTFDPFKMEACFIRDENVAFTSSSGYIYKTTDFGNNWLKIFDYDSLGFFFRGRDISFLNEQTGFAVGEYAISSDSNGAGILTTYDGGDNWDLGWKFPNIPNYYYNLNSIHIKNNIGWSVGRFGMILKYAPQTGWVQQTSVTDLPLNKVFFSDENHGWIAGGYQHGNDFQKILLRTTNGGVNWITVPNVPYLFRDIAFIDNNLGWAIGYDSSGIGGILKTTDGGFTWEINSGNLPAQLNALHIKDNYGWAVGDNGLILRTTETGGVGVEDENDNSLPTEFVLEQNYPNPFNPGTVIRYSLSVNSFVSLKVYDILGREIKTLVNKEQPAGSYEVQLTINDEPLTSGIYLYRITAGAYTLTKKMLFLK